MAEGDLKPLYDEVTKQLSYDYAFVGRTVLSDNHWATLMEISRTLSAGGLKGSGLLPETQASLIGRFQHLMHEVSRSMNNIDLRKRDQQDLANQIRAARAVRKAAQEAGNDAT